jgi:hypothetical protein
MKILKSYEIFESFEILWKLRNFDFFLKILNFKILNEIFEIVDRIYLTQGVLTLR